MSISLAITDGVLLLSCVFCVLGRFATVGARLSICVIGLAAALGVLKFSELAPMPGMHLFFSQLSSVAALPLLAVATLSPRALVSSTAKFAWIFFVITATVGLIMTAGLGLKLYGPVLAAGSVLAMVVGLARQGHWRQSSGALIMLTGMVLFVAKVGVLDPLVPGDFLHLGLALGLMLLQSTDTAQAVA